MSLQDMIAGLLSIMALFSFWAVVYFAILGLPLLTVLAKKNISIWPRSMIMGIFAVLPLFSGPENNPALPVLFLTGVLTGATCVKPAERITGNACSITKAPTQSE